jgi:hypothetical protein
MAMLTRRTLVLGALSMPAASAFAAAKDVIVYRDPGCTCCEKWGRQIQSGLKRTVRFVDAPDRTALKRKFGVPVALSSCHTAIIDGLAFEGHVPVKDVNLLLIMRPPNVGGLGVPEMPTGSPGMESPGAAQERYVVYAFGRFGQKVYARH